MRAASAGAPGISYSSTLSTVRLDLAAPDTWPRALERVRRVFLALAEPAHRGSGLPEFLERAAWGGVDHVVLLSTADPQPGTPHRQAETHIDAVGLPRTFLRAATLHQELIDTCAGEIAEHDRLRLPIGAGRTAYVDARDVARVAAATLVAHRPALRASYDLTGQEALSGLEVAALLSRVLGREIAFEPMPPAYSPQPTPATVETLQRLLGRAPTSLAEFVVEHRLRWRTPVRSGPNALVRAARPGSNFTRTG